MVDPDCNNIFSYNYSVFLSHGLMVPFINLTFILHASLDDDDDSKNNEDMGKEGKREKKILSSFMVEFF
jgi:hypothetical protein